MSVFIVAQDFNIFQLVEPRPVVLANHFSRSIFISFLVADCVFALFFNILHKHTSSQNISCGTSLHKCENLITKEELSRIRGHA